MEREKETVVFLWELDKSVVRQSRPMGEWARGDCRDRGLNLDGGGCAGYGLGK